jgi:outer membrane protein OmpA-like peptidoglycan-associated protein
MKALIIASLMALPGLALADHSTAPRGPDFVAATAPRPVVDRSLAASSGTRPIGPLELVMFGFDQTSLDPAAVSQLDTLAAWMKHHPDQNVVIEGHTDRIGPAEYNDALGARRAVSVRAHLESWGIPGDRIVVATFGERGAHHEENSNDRRVRVFASSQDRQTLAHLVLENSSANAVAWTDRGTKLSIEK